MSTYVFEKPLIRGTMLKRKSQFTALVDIDGEELIAHIRKHLKQALNSGRSRWISGRKE